MIAALAVLAVQPAPVRVLELVEDSDLVVVQAYLKAPPKMTEREAAAWQVLGRVLLMGTVEMSGETIFLYGSQAGLPPSIEVMPDFMRLEVVLPKAGLSVAGDLVFSILTRPALLEQDIAETIVELRGEDRAPWIAAISGIDFRYDRLRQGDVRAIWTRAMRPENINIVVGGGIASGEGKKEFEARFARWTAPRDPGPPRTDTAPKPKVSHLGPVSTFLLSGRTMTPASTASAAKLVAIFAIGVGTESSMFRALRQERGLSYMQTAILWPTSEGWVPSFVMLRRTREDEGKLATDMKDALLKDIEGWNEGTLKRAQAMAESAFSWNLSFSPVWLGEGGAMGATIFDRCAWRGYLEMVGSGALREDVLVRAMMNVDLDQLKQEGRRVLDECNVGWLPGSP